VVVLLLILLVGWCVVVPDNLTIKFLLSKSQNSRAGTSQGQQKSLLHNSSNNLRSVLFRGVVFLVAFCWLHLVLGVSNDLTIKLIHQCS
jgi:hypothetical protein